MQVIIDIPEEMHKSIEQGSFGVKYTIYDLVGCIMNGTPLPAGHGRLIDAEKCGDAISRQAVIDTIDKWIKSRHVLITLPANEVTPLFESVHKLPPVTAQPKMGRWIYRKEEDSYRCSLCTFPCHKDNMGALPTRYCAECGAKMQEVEE